MLGVDGAFMDLDGSHGTNQSPNPLGDMLGRDWCHRGGKRSRYNVNSASSRTRNSIFIQCLVVYEYGNIMIGIGR